MKTEWMRLLFLAIVFFCLTEVVSAAEIKKEDYAAIVAARNAEKEATLATSPFIALRDKLFARYVRDPAQKPQAKDVVVTTQWRIVLEDKPDPSAQKMAVMLQRFAREVMGLDVPIEKTFPGNRKDVILLKTAGGGRQGVADSFTIKVEPGSILVTGIDPGGLRDGVVRLIDLFGFRMAPFLQEQETVYTPRIPMRRSGSVPNYDSTILLGGNTILVGGGELYAFSTSNVIPELAVRRVPGSVENLATAAKNAKAQGLEAHAHFGIRTKFPKDDPVLLAHPEIRGALTWSADGEYNLCTEHPLVQKYLEESMEGIFRGAPDLQGVEIIIGGENFYHCFMRPFPQEKGHTNCERCDAIGPDRVVSNLVNRLAAAARRANPKAVIEAWPYSAGTLWSADKYQSGLIALLEPGTAILTEAVKDTLIDKPFGIQKNLWDYSIDLIGPSERAMQQIKLCDARGIPTTVLSMYEMSFEAALLPEIPCMDRWVGRAAALADSGADGVYLWKMGPFYGGFSSEVYKHLLWNPAPPQEELLQKLAARAAGFKAGPHLREAWHNVSEAIGWSPEIPSYYKGPLYIGPAHPLVADKSAAIPEVFDGYYLFLAEATLSQGLQARPTYFTDAPGGAQADAFTQSYEKMAAYLVKAVAALDRAEPLVPAQNKMLFQSQAYPIRWLYHSVRTQVNFCKSCKIRDALVPLANKGTLGADEQIQTKALHDAWKVILQDELANTLEAAPISRADVRLDCYYRGDHMFNHLWDMLDAKALLLRHELDVFLPKIAKQCGIQ